MVGFTLHQAICADPVQVGLENWVTQEERDLRWPFWGHFGTILEHFATILGPFWDNFGLQLSVREPLPGLQEYVKEWLVNIGTYKNDGFGSNRMWR